MGTRHPSFAPFQAYQASDGYLTVCVVNDKQFQTLCNVINLEQLVNDEDEWINLFEQTAIPCGPINNMKDVAESPQRTLILFEKKSVV